MRGDHVQHVLPVREQPARSSSTSTCRNARFLCTDSSALAAEAMCAGADTVGIHTTRPPRRAATSTASGFAPPAGAVEHDPAGDGDPGGRVPLRREHRPLDRGSLVRLEHREVDADRPVRAQHLVVEAVAFDQAGRTVDVQVRDALDQARAHGLPCRGRPVTSAVLVALGSGRVRGSSAARARRPGAVVPVLVVPVPVVPVPVVPVLLVAAGVPAGTVAAASGGGADPSPAAAFRRPITCTAAPATTKAAPTAIHSGSITSRAIAATRNSTRSGTFAGPRSQAPVTTARRRHGEHRRRERDEDVHPGALEHQAHAAVGQHEDERHEEGRQRVLPGQPHGLHRLAAGDRRRRERRRAPSAGRPR